MMKMKIVVMLAVIALIAATASADIVIRGIQDENDDGEEYLNTILTGSYAQGSGFLVSSDLEMGGNSDGSPGDTGLMWTGLGLQYDGLGIPQGASITSAKNGPFSM